MGRGIGETDPTNWERAALRLDEAERVLAELWVDELPNLDGDRVDDLVAAHRAVRDALRTVRRAAGRDRGPG